MYESGKEIIIKIKVVARSKYVVNSQSCRSIHTKGFLPHHIKVLYLLSSIIQRVILCAVKSSQMVLVHSFAAIDKVCISLYEEFY